MVSTFAQAETIEKILGGAKNREFAFDVKVDASGVPFGIDFPKGYDKSVSADLLDYLVSADGKRLVCLVYATAITASPEEKTKSGALSPHRDFQTQVTSYIRVLDIGTGKEICHSKKDDAWMFSLAVTADGRYIFAGSCRWVLTTLKRSEPVESISRSSVRVFDATTGKECYRYEVDKGTMPKVSVSADARYVATASKKGVVIYRTPRAVWVKSTGQEKNAKRGKPTK